MIVDVLLFLAVGIAALAILWAAADALGIIDRQIERARKASD